MSDIPHSTSARSSAGSRLAQASSSSDGPPDGPREMQIAWGTAVDFSNPETPKARYIVQLTSDADATEDEVATGLMHLRMIDATLRLLMSLNSFASMPEKDAKLAASSLLRSTCERASSFLDRLEDRQGNMGIQVARSSEGTQTFFMPIKITCTELGDETTTALMVYLDRMHSERHSERHSRRHSRRRSERLSKRRSKRHYEELKDSEGDAVDLYGRVHSMEGRNGKVPRIVIGHLIHEEPHLI